VEVPILGGDTVARLAKRIAVAFPAWNVGAEDTALFLVPGDLERVVQRDPAREEEVLVAANLCLATDALAEAGIRDRSCLLARLPDPPAAAPGECTRAARSFAKALLTVHYNIRRRWSFGGGGIAARAARKKAASHVPCA